MNENLVNEEELKGALEDSFGKQITSKFEIALHKTQHNSLSFEEAISSYKRNKINGKNFIKRQKSSPLKGSFNSSLNRSSRAGSQSKFRKD